MVRYPEKFHIQPITETERGGNFIYEDDVTHQPFVFEGRIRLIPPKTQSTLQGDLTKATHFIHCGLLNFDVQIGLTVYDYSTEKEYEILLPDIGQRGMKLWVALS